MWLTTRNAHAQQSSRNQKRRGERTGERAGTLQRRCRGLQEGSESQASLGHLTQLFFFDLCFSLKENELSKWKKEKKEERERRRSREGEIVKPEEREEREGGGVLMLLNSFIIVYMNIDFLILSF